MGDERSSLPTDDERLVHLPLMVSVAQRTLLRQLARERQVSVGSVAREAIREYLATVPGQPQTAGAAA